MCVADKETQSGGESLSIGAVVGGVVAFLFLLLLIILIVIVWRRRRGKRLELEKVGFCCPEENGFLSKLPIFCDSSNGVKIQSLTLAKLV